MTESLRQFMAGIIDYAGLFPPAKLPLKESIHNYSAYRQNDDSWMLSRFILPVSLFHEAGNFSDLFTPDNPFSFSVLPQKADSIDEFNNAIATAISSCMDFCNTHPGAVTTEMMEVKLPEEAVASQDQKLLKGLMDETADKLQGSSLPPQRIFYEGHFGANWRDDNESVLAALKEHNRDFAGIKNYEFAAYKIRCGGITADLFPSVEQIAFILNSTHQHNVALKATAGLHHPVRHYAEEVGTTMHGFFNVFGGAMLAGANDFSTDTLVEILNEEDTGAFHFTSDAFTWKDYSVSTEEIKHLRQNALLSYGSCSFDEPREDLSALGLL